MNLPLDTKLVSTWGPPARRKSPRELARLSHFSQLCYYLENGLPSDASDVERWAELRREDAQDKYQSGDELTIVHDRAAFDDGPEPDEDY